MKNLTAKQEAVCQCYIENGGNKSEAYRVAYDAVNMSMEAVNVEACRLFKSPNVALRVIELQGNHRERHNVTIDNITKELDQALYLAREARQPSAMINAIMSKAKLHGLIINKKQYSGHVDLSTKTDAELRAMLNTN